MAEGCLVMSEGERDRSHLVRAVVEKKLHITRGDGVWLHADDGKAYLDCYNNVAHVGHAHPRVANAVARQLHILNTNTR